MKRRIVYLVIALSLVVGGVTFAANSALIRGIDKKVIQVISPNEIITVNNGSLSLATYRVLMFNADLTLQINGAGATFDYPANTPYGVGVGVTSITITGLGAATTALVM